MQVGLMAGALCRSTSVCVMAGGRLDRTTLPRRPVEEKIAVTRRFAAEMLPLFDSGVLNPVIDSRYPFDRIADAHRHMACQRQRRQDHHRHRLPQDARGDERGQFPAGEEERRRRPVRMRKASCRPTAGVIAGGAVGVGRGHVRGLGVAGLVGRADLDRVLAGLGCPSRATHCRHASLVTSVPSAACLPLARGRC